jgi:hypothetical protein
MMLSIGRAVVLPVFLTASLVFLSGCGGSPTTPPAGGGFDLKTKYEQGQKNQEYMEKMKNKGVAPPDATKTPKDGDKD